MSFATTELQVIPTPVLDADPHAAVSHLQDLKAAIRATLRGWIDAANALEAAHTNRLAIPVLATLLGIFGAAIIGVNL